MGTPPSRHPPRLLRIFRLLPRLCVALFIGALLTIGTSWLAAMRGLDAQAWSVSWSGSDGQFEWDVSLFKSWTAARVDLSRNPAAIFNWNPSQAAGPPNASPGTDNVLAWASDSTDAQREWLELIYPAAIVPVAIIIHETYSPGAVDEIKAYDPAGKVVSIWTGQDPSLLVPPTPGGAGISNIPLSVKFPTQRVRLEINSPVVPSWNEIDAVGLIDAAGTTHWASGAIASSWYGQSRVRAGPVPPTSVPRTIDDLSSELGPLMRLAKLSEPGGPATGPAQHSAYAFGWPFLAMWTEPPAAVSSGILTNFGNPPVSSTGRSSTSIKTPASVAAMPPHLPGRFLPMGFALNSAIYGMLAVLAYVLLWRPRRLLRELRRMRSGHCIQCGYDLGYDFRAGCPDCGWRRDGLHAGNP